MVRPCLGAADIIAAADGPSQRLAQVSRGCTVHRPPTTTSEPTGTSTTELIFVLKVQLLSELMRSSLSSDGEAKKIQRTTEATSEEKKLVL